MEYDKKSYIRNILASVIAILLVIQCMVISPVSVYARTLVGSYKDTTNEYQYNHYSDNTAEITKFYNTTNATKVNIPDKLDEIRVVAIGTSAFSSLSNAALKNITEITIPDTITKIGSQAFRGININKITIPGSVREIGTQAFYSCTSLQEVYILYGVQIIGDSAFAMCTSLKKVAISPSTESIGSKSFQTLPTAPIVELQANPDSTAGIYTSTYTKIEHKELSNDSPVGYKYDVDEYGKVIITGYVGTSKTPEIPQEINGKDVTIIADSAFKDKPITSIKLPDTLTTIGVNAFANTGLTEVEIPDNVSFIGKGAFDDKSDVILKGSSSGLDKFMETIQNIKFVPYGPGLTLYHELSIYTDGNGYITMGKSGEYKRDFRLKIEARPNYGYAFEKWTVEGEGSFGDANNTSTYFEMPNIDTSIKAHFVKLQRDELVIENGIVKQYNGYGILTIPAEWGKTGKDDKEKIPTVSIDLDVFYGYDNLGYRSGSPTKVEIPSTITSIPTGVFNYCSSLSSIQVDSKNQNFSSSEDGVLFNKDKTTLIRYPRAKTDTNYIIPDSVTTIAPYAFYGCYNLKEIKIPDGVTTIGASAFEGCSSLTTITIPSVLNTIDSSTFEDCSSLTKIEIPEGITNIGVSAFEGCSSLTKITIPSSTISIGYLAFHNCSSLKYIEVSENNQNYLANDNVLFKKNGDNTLTLILYPMNKDDINYSVSQDVNNIESHAFYSNRYITNIELPDTITNINPYTFYNCSKLTTINIPNVSNIGSSAFEYCISLTKINIPSNVTSIGSRVFYGCANLEAITVNENNSKYFSFDGVLFSENSNGNNTLIVYPMGKDGINYTVKEKVYDTNTERISSYAFSGTKLVDIDIPESVHTFETYTFSGINNLNRITIRNKNVGFNPYYYLFSGISKSNLLIRGWLDSTSQRYAFENSIKFEQLDGYNDKFVINEAGELLSYKGNDTEIVIPSSITNTEGKVIAITSIGPNAFMNNKTITSVKIPLSITKIGINAFEGCSALTSDGLKLPDSITEIGANAFQDCTSLTSINIPARVNNIAPKAFTGCTSLTSINVHSSNSKYASVEVRDENNNITGAVLTNTDKTTLIQVPNGLSGTYTLPDYITTIGTNAFEGCDKITKVIINYTTNTLNKIGYAAFRNAFTNPVEIVIHGVDEIENNAFEGCTGITKITIPNTVSRIGDNVFDGCTSLTHIKVAEDNLFYKDIDGVLFSKENGTTEFKQQLVRYSQGRTASSYTIPDGTLGIASNAFFGCNSLKTIEFPAQNTVAYIGSRAFDGCAFEQLTLPEGLLEIKDFAFANNYLINVELPKTLQKLYTGAFTGNDKLQSVKVYNENMEFMTEGKIFDEIQDKSENNILTLHGWDFSTTKEYVNGRKINFISLGSKLLKEEKIELFAEPNANSEVIVDITATQVDTIINTANAINVTVGTAVYAEAVTVNFSAEAIQSICNEDNINSLKINTCIDNIELNRTQLDTIKQQAGNNTVSITIKRIKSEDFTEELGNQEIIKSIISQNNPDTPNETIIYIVTRVNSL